MFIWPFSFLLEEDLRILSIQYLRHEQALEPGYSVN
jgi:hypothetical protein